MNYSALFRSKKFKVFVSLFLALLTTIMVYPSNASYLEDGDKESRSEVLLFVVLSVSYYAVFLLGSYLYKQYNGKQKLLIILKQTQPLRRRLALPLYLFIVAIFVLAAGFLISSSIKPIQPGDVLVLTQQYLDDVISGKKQINKAVTDFKPTGYTLVEGDGEPPGRNRLNAVYTTYVLTNETPFTYMYVVLTANRLFFWQDGKAHVLRTETEIAGLTQSARNLAISKNLVNNDECSNKARKVFSNPASTEEEKKKAVADRNSCMNVLVID